VLKAVYINRYLKMKDVYRFYIEVEKITKMPNREKMMAHHDIVSVYPIYSERYKEVTRFRTRKRITAKKLKKYETILKATNELLSAESS